MVVVSDTGPINYLVLIGHVDALGSLFEIVVIPQAVFSELTRKDTPTVVREWIDHRPPWIEVRDAEQFPGYPDLDPGESQAIALAKSLNADLLCDDRAGRKVASEEGLRVSGTLGVLQVAHLRKLLDIREALATLGATNYRRSQGLFELVLEQTLRLEKSPGTSLDQSG